MVPLKPSKTPIERYCSRLTIDNGLGSHFIYLFLSRVNVESAVECELLLPEGPLILLAQIQSDVPLVRVEVETYLGTHIYFFAIKRADSSHDNDIPTLNLYGL
jgi:hypothetical protein